MSYDSTVISNNKLNEQKIILEPTEIKYATAGDVKIAYQKIGNHQSHLVIISGWVSNIEEIWNMPQLAAWIKYLSKFTTIIIFDKRGSGLSDRLNEDNLPDLDTRVKDILAVLSDLGLKKVDLLGLSDGGATALKFAHKWPHIVNKVVLFAAFAKWMKSINYPYGLAREKHMATRNHIYENWGSPIGARLMLPNFNDKITLNQWAKFLRNSASPAIARGFYTLSMQIDVRSILKTLSLPILIMHRKNDRLMPFGHSTYLHKMLPKSTLISLNGNDHLPWFNTTNEELMTIFEFLCVDNQARTTKLPAMGVDDVTTLYRVKDFLEKNYHDEAICIKSLTKQFGINSFKIKTGFKSIFGIPIITFLTRLRLEKAKSILIEENETVFSVAEKVGYCYANNFAAAFKRLYGLSPKEFAKSRKPF